MYGKLGSWVFIAGVLIAIILGIFPSSDVMLTILVIIGLIVGILNITEKEVKPFLFAGTVLVLVTYLGGGVFETEQLAIIGRILDAIMAMAVPATIIVALRSVFELSKN